MHMSSEQPRQDTTAIADTARNYVGNWTDPDGEVHEITNPATNQTFATVTYSTEADVDRDSTRGVPGLA
jgi:hypothetical protein